jgi:hypothetical protein
MAIIASHAALFFRRFLGAESFLPLALPTATPAPALPPGASNAASGSAAMRNNSCGVNFRGSVMDSPQPLTATAVVKGKYIPTGQIHPGYFLKKA